MTFASVSKPKPKKAASVKRKGKPVPVRQKVVPGSGFGEVFQPRSLPIQPQLKIGAPNDKYEQEADRVADEVMRMPESQVQRQVEPMEEEEEMVQTQPIADTIQRKCAACEEEETLQRMEMEEEEEETLQTKTQGGGVSAVMPGIQSGISRLRQGGGVALPASTRSFMESRFGHDFTGVKVHTDSQAANLSRSVNARAFTVGRDVFFNKGEFQPNTSSGMRLLAHELTHTLQQSPRVIHRKGENVPGSQAVFDFAQLIVNGAFNSSEFAEALATEDFTNLQLRDLKERVLDLQTTSDPLIDAALEEIDNVLAGRTDLDKVEFVPTPCEAGESASVNSNTWVRNERLTGIAEGTESPLKTGEQGEAVKLVQQALLQWGCEYSDESVNLLPKYRDDGDFGREMKLGVKEFQKHNGLSRDGVVGPNTLFKLQEEVIIQSLLDKQTAVQEEMPPSHADEAEEISDSEDSSGLTINFGDWEIFKEKDLFEKKEDKSLEVNFVTLPIPVPFPASLDIAGEVKGTLNLEGSVGPGALRNIRVKTSNHPVVESFCSREGKENLLSPFGVFTPVVMPITALLEPGQASEPFEECLPGIEYAMFQAKAQLDIPAHFSAKVSMDAALKASLEALYFIEVASLETGLEASAEAESNPTLKNSIEVSYTEGNIAFNNNFGLEAALDLGFSLDAFIEASVLGDFDAFSWRHEWELAKESLQPFSISIGTNMSILKDDDEESGKATLIDIPKLGDKVANLLKKADDLMKKASEFEEGTLLDDRHGLTSGNEDSLISEGIPKGQRLEIKIDGNFRPVGEFIEYNTFQGERMIKYRDLRIAPDPRITPGSEPHSAMLPLASHGERWRIYTKSINIKYPTPVYLPLDNMGRPTGAKMTIIATYKNLPKRQFDGDPPGWQGGFPPFCQNRTHLLARTFAGKESDQKKENIVTLYDDANKKGMRKIEDKVRNSVENNYEIIDYEVYANYDGAEVIPKSISIKATGNQPINDKVQNHPQENC